MSKETVALRKSIIDATRSAFTELRKNVTKENFYTFALYTSELGDYIVSSANTEEGLLRRAQEYQSRSKKETLPNLQNQLRWSAADWAYHCTGEDHFEAAQKLLDARPDCTDMDDDECEEEVALRFKVMIEALQALDKEGFFGKGKAREKVVLLVMLGDQTDKMMLDHAKQLNPPKVFQAFSKPFIHETTGKVKPIGSKKVYETNDVVISKNKKVLACTGDGAIFAFALPSCKETFLVRVKESISTDCIVVSPDGEKLIVGWNSLTGDDVSGLRCYNMADRKVLWETKRKDESVSALDISVDGKLLATASQEGIISLCDTANGKVIRQMKDHKAWVQTVLFSHDGKQLFSADREKSIRIWDIATGKQIAQLADSGDDLALSPDGQILAVASGFNEKDKAIRLWDLKTKKLLKKLDAVDGTRFRVMNPAYENVQVDNVAFSADDKWLVAIRSNPGSAVLWDWKNDKEFIWMDPDYESLNKAVFLPDNKTIAIAGRSMDGPPLLLWDISEAEKKK